MQRAFAFLCNTNVAENILWLASRAGYSQYFFNFYHCTQLLQLSFFASTIIAIIAIIVLN